MKLPVTFFRLRMLQFKINMGYKKDGYYYNYSDYVSPAV